MRRVTQDNRKLSAPTIRRVGATHVVQSVGASFPTFFIKGTPLPESAVAEHNLSDASKFVSGVPIAPPAD